MLRYGQQDHQWHEVQGIARLNQKRMQLLSSNSLFCASTLTWIHTLVRGISIPGSSACSICHAAKWHLARVPRSVWYVQRPIAPTSVVARPLPSIGARYGRLWRKMLWLVHVALLTLLFSRNSPESEDNMTPSLLSTTESFTPKFHSFYWKVSPMRPGSFIDVVPHPQWFPNICESACTTATPEARSLHSSATSRNQIWRAWEGRSCLGTLFWGISSCPSKCWHLKRRESM